MSERLLEERLAEAERERDELNEDVRSFERELTTIARKPDRRQGESRVCFWLRRIGEQLAEEADRAEKAEARVAALEAEREHAEYLITNKQNAVNAYVDRVQLLEGLLARERQCSTCCGTPHVSGLPCICGGKNSREEEVKGLRLAAMTAEHEHAVTSAAQRMMQPRVSARNLVSRRNIELEDAIKGWRGLTEEEREDYYVDNAAAKEWSTTGIALHLLKAVAR